MNKQEQIEGLITKYDYEEINKRINKAMQELGNSYLIIKRLVDKIERIDLYIKEFKIRLEKLEEHKTRQIDENRKISRYIDYLEHKLRINSQFIEGEEIA